MRVSSAAKIASRPKGATNQGTAAATNATVRGRGLQHAQVGLAAAQHTGDLLVVGEDVGRLGIPALVVATELAELSGEVALAQRRGARHLDLDGEAQHLPLARREAQPERRDTILDPRGGCSKRTIVLRSTSSRP